MNNDSTPIETVPLFGSMMGKLDLLDTTADKAKPITDLDRANISALKGSSGYVMKSAASDVEKIDETEKNLFTISVGFDSDVADGWADAVNSSKTKVNKDAPDVSFSVGIILVFEAADDGNVYFNQLAIGADAEVGMGVTLTYITPIGIPVYASFSFSIGIGISGSLVPKDEDDPPLLDARTSWKGKVTGEVEIASNVGVGVELGVGVSLLKMYLTGTAEVNFAFTLVNLSASISASFRAAFGVRFFIFSKEWTIISKTWGVTAEKALRASRSKLYEPLSGFDQLTRDYAYNRSEWISDESPGLFRALMADSNGFGSVSERAVRENGAYPYPSNKLVNLPNGEILWVFVDDVPNRSDENRTAVYYSIIAADGSASVPRLIDDDGTLDEAPDVLDLGNGEVLITWSDASREFTVNDKEIDVLTHMDISAAFYSVEKGMGEPMKITHTSGRTEINKFGQRIMLGDYCGDTSPKAAYDPESETILLYYIKSDYYDGVNGAEIEEGSIDESGSQISNEDAQLVIGDIVNAFSLITYRFARKDASGNWVWNGGNDYTPAEKDTFNNNIQFQIDNGLLPLDYTFEQYKKDWYGQRFLDVSQMIDITEIRTITDGRNSTDYDGNSISSPPEITVTQEAVMRRSPLDPRVVDTAVISYNGLALFAYSTDEDWNLKTDNDQEIYMQIYNFSENSFSHPIRLTTDKVRINGVDSPEYYVKDSQPKFVRSNGITYLFWNRNGSIAYMDISGLVKYGLKKVNLGYGFEVYIIDKNNDNYLELEGSSQMEGKEASTGKWGEIMLAVDKDINPNPSEDNEATQDRAITSYDVVASDDGDIYLVWTENQTVLKDTGDAGRASDPENQAREKQIFIARWEPQTMIERVQLDYINEYGEEEFEVKINKSVVKCQYVYPKGKGYYPAGVYVDGVYQEIDYTKTPDVNGFIGGAKAGDPIIGQNYVSTGKAGWSKPIQITSEQGANYDELGVTALEGNAGLKIAFIKYIQTLENINGAGGTGKVFKPDLEDRKLGLLTFRPASGVEFDDSSIKFGNEKPKAGQNVTVSAFVKNTGIDAVYNARVEFYQVADRVETLIDTKYNLSNYMDSGASDAGKSALVGGDQFNPQISFEMPENNGDVSIKTVLRYVDSDGFDQSIEAQKPFTFEAVPEISDLRYEFTGIGKIILDGIITNAGNKDDTLNVEISIADKYGAENTIDVVPVALKQGESSYFSTELEIPGSCFTETASGDGQPFEGIREIAQIKVGAGVVKDEITVVRSSPSRAVEVMNEVAGFSVSEKNISIQKGTTGRIEHNISYKKAAGGVQGEKAALRDETVVEYISSNPDVVQVAADGTLYAMSEGTATVQAVLMPVTTISIATKGSMAGGKVAPLAQQLTSPATLPGSVIRIENVDVRVYSEATTYTIAATAGAGGSISPSGRVVVNEGASQTFTITPYSNYSIYDVKVDGVSQGRITSYTFSNVTGNHTIEATFSYTGGSSGGGKGSQGSSSSGSGSTVIIIPPAADNPDSETQAEIKVPVTVDGNNNVTAEVTRQMVINAINKAQAEAEKNGYGQNGIILVLAIETEGKVTGAVNVNLPKEVQEAIIANNITTTVIVVDNPDIRLSMDIETVKEINRQANADANITATQQDNSRLNEEARTAIGDRPVFDIRVNYGSNSQVRNFGDGKVWVTIPYTLGENEKVVNVCAVYIDENQNVHWITDSVYDSGDQVLRFRTNHFSLYGVGYNGAASAFTDIEGSWAKNDIEFVVSRGLFNGTSKATFSPGIAMTRGMFVTVLGRLAKADVSEYKSSSFSDVKNDTYYMWYIEWARLNGIVKGIGNGMFAPDEPITREQMAVIMQNYANTMGISLPKVYEENTFADSEKISTYAVEAVKLMQMSGILNGKNGNIFDPQNAATRAEVSAVLRRFVEQMLSR